MLTDVACRNAKPRESDYKLAAGESLYLLVGKNGRKVWRWKYRIAGREKMLTIGRYPAVSPKDARAARDKARAQLDQGIDPSAEKQRRKAGAALAALDSFEKAARAWHAAKSPLWSPRYASNVMARLEGNAFPAFGRMPIGAVTPPIVLAAMRKVEARGAKNMALRVCNHVSDVFVWAIASGLAEQDPAATIRKALAPHDAKLRPATTAIAQARQVLKATEQLSAYWSTLLASRLLALTAARPGVVRLAERHEFEGLDGKAPLWRIPAAKMKLTQARKRDVTWEFVIPLSRQAAAIARTAIATSDACRSAEGPHWLFPGVARWTKPISDSTLSALYLDAGFRGVHVPHGWRSTFSTVMNERAALEDRERDRDIIDLMLAHAKEGVEPIYNRASYQPRRRELAQAWADLLMEGMAEPDMLVPPQRLWRARPAPDAEAGHDGRHKPANRPARPAR